MPHKPVSVGIHVPGFSSAPLASGAEYTRFFREAEALGLDALWFEDRIFHSAPLLDSMTLLTWAAACTRRMQLGPAVMVLNVRNVAAVARQASTLQHLTGGRLALGISAGGQPPEYSVAHLPIEHRVGVFLENVSLLRALLKGEPVQHHGAHFDLDGATIRPAADVPLYLGGRVEAVLRRAGRIADGWIMGPFGGVDEFKRSWATVLDAATAAGRDPESLTAGRLVYVAVDEDKSKARDTLGAFLDSYYQGRINVDAEGVFGPASEVASRLREFVDAGMTHFMLGIPTLDSEHLRVIAEQVAPVLRA
jgi:alkanesulfonate monooxygenase SsuD/methylene tetrahydromethanopterin reductase-like flavin-dependent oxidoreductase (luciferase family)